MKTINVFSKLDFGLFAICVLFVATPDTANSQVETTIRAVDRIGQAVEGREQNRQAGSADAAERRREEEEVFRQREEIRQNPGSFPRKRNSYEAALNENPWARDSLRASGAPPRVELFVAQRCLDCDRMERYLDEVGVPYSRFFLTPGSEAEEIYLAQIGRGPIPVLRVNGRVLRGYDPEAARQLILSEK